MRDLTKTMTAMLTAMALLWLLPLCAMADDNYYSSELTYKDGLASNHILRITQDDYGFIWIQTSNGWNRYDGSRFSLTDRAPKLAPDQVHQGLKEGETIEEHDGRLTYVNRFSGRRHEFQLRSRILSPNLAKCYHSVRTADNKIWVATNGNGLFCYDIDADCEYHHRAFESHVLWLRSNAWTCIFEDRNHDLWLGSEHNGVTHISKTNVPACHYFFPVPACGIHDITNYVRAMGREPQTGNVHMLTREDIEYVYTPDLSRLISKESMPFSINEYCCDTHGHFFAATEGGGVRIDGKWVTDVKFVRALACDHRGRMWVYARDRGIAMMQQGGDGRWNVRQYLDQIFSSLVVNDIACDKNGFLWCATDSGIVAFNIDDVLKGSKSVIRIATGPTAVPERNIVAIHVDAKNRIWVGESGNGVTRVIPDKNYKSFSFRTIDGSCNMDNKLVQAFVSDNEGNLWASTEMGVTYVNPVNMTCVNFTPAGNIAQNIFIAQSALCIDGNQLLFASTDGVLVVDATVLSKFKPEPPTIYFSNLLYGELCNGEQFDRDTIITDVDEICLPYNLNAFSIGYTTFDYNQLRPSRFQHWLENGTRSWTRPVARGVRYFPSLSPGTYYLHVRACNQYGLWGEEKVLKIRILAPWWKQWWFILLCILLLGFVVYHIYRFYVFRRLTRSSIEELVSEKNKLKKLFVRNITEEASADGPHLQLSERIDQVFEEEIGNQEFTVDDFAARLGYSRTTFFRVVREATGLSPREFMRSRRMKRAAELILQTDLTVAEIAVKIGMDQFYLSRCFKEQFGATPIEYRRQNARKQ